MLFICIFSNKFDLIQTIRVSHTMPFVFPELNLTLSTICPSKMLAKQHFACFLKPVTLLRFLLFSLALPLRYRGFMVFWRWY